MQLLKHALFFLLIIAFSTSTHAQSFEHKCGTEASDVLIQRLMRNKAALQDQPIERRLDPLYVPLAFHLVAQSNGSERIPVSDVMEQVCALNQIYSAFDVQFYLRDDAFSSINNTSAFENGQSASSLFNNSKDPNALNIFIVKHATSPGGGVITLAFYDPSRDFVVTRKDMVEALVSNVIPHEIGHYFSLLHTFNGWEPAPYEELLHGNPVAIPLAPDGATPIELVDKTNCEDAGDFICDTEPDYNFGINQNGCQMPITVMDPNGDAITVAKENYMTYFFNCNNYFFTPEQIGLIRTDYNSTERAPIRDDDFNPSEGTIVGIPDPLTPGNGDFESFYNSVLFDWTQVSGADRYFLEVSTNTGFNELVVSKFVRNTSYLANELNSNTQYFWRVKPVNDLTYCSPYSPLRSFSTGSDITAIRELAGIDRFEIHPNPSKSGEPVEMYVEGSMTGEILMSVVDLTGKIIFKQQGFLNGHAQNISLPLQSIAPGMYFVQLKAPVGQITKKVWISQ